MLGLINMNIAAIERRASYLRDSVFAGSDGIVTTFAIVAGSTGANLDSSVVLILGFANLFADGFSMAAGNYLGVKSELDYEEAENIDDNIGQSPIIHSIFTFTTFNVAGFFPLLPYVFGLSNPFNVSILIVFLELFFIGVMRTKFTKKSWIVSGWEMLTVGGIAAVVAYGIGLLSDKYLF